MSISPDLMLAILAMDSYNRGYNAGINLPSEQTKIGNANIQANSSNLDTPGNTGRDAAASFYAQSYTWNGQRVISYRGTDTEFSSGPDRPAFYMGVGDYNTTQGNLAVDFYKTLNGGNATLNPNIVVTGHSLGGGLAGYVGSLYGLQGRLFDNMAFEAAAGTANDNDLLFRRSAA